MEESAAIQITSGGDLAKSTADLIGEWLEFEGIEGASPATLATYRKGLGIFAAWLTEQQTTGAVTPQVVRAFKASLIETYSPQTVNLRLAAIRSFYRFLVNTDRLAINPAGEVRGMKRPKSKQHKRDALTNREVLGVLETCNSGKPEGARDRAILSLMAYCGLREIEIYRANIGNLKTQGDRLVLEVHGKGRPGPDDIAVIRHDQEQAIRTWLAHRLTFENHAPSDPLFISLSNRSRGHRLALRSIRAVVKNKFQVAGVVGDRKTAHSFRHSAITNLIRQGAAPLQVKAFARHSSLDTTLGYYHEVSRLEHPAEDLIDYAA